MSLRDQLAILFAVSILAGFTLPRLWQWYRIRRVLKEEFGKPLGKYGKMLRHVLRDSK